MGKDFKIMIAALVFTFLLIVGGAALFGGKEAEVNEVGGASVEIQGIEVNPLLYELGDVPINGGIVTKEYEIKNTTSQTLKLKKIATSCMCTQAKVVLGDKETRFFGMEHGMDKNPPINFEIGSGETGKAIVTFDPAAHGPEGVGAFERIVWLTFSDPSGVKELKFEGTVVNN